VELTLLIAPLALAIYSAATGYLRLKWLLTVLFAALTYGLLSCLVAARRLYFLSMASSHGALLAVVLAIPLSRAFQPLTEYGWALVVGLALMYFVGLMISKGVDPDVATAAFVSMAASLSVVGMYFVLSNYPMGADLWAVVLGDPLLASWGDVAYAGAITAATAISTILTYREQICIGLERDCAVLSGINVALYDWLLYTLLGVGTIALVRIVGFVLEHVLISLPAATAVMVARGSREVLGLSVGLSVAASAVGLCLAVSVNLSPTGLIGLLLFLTYLTVLLSRRVLS